MIRSSGSSPRHSRLIRVRKSVDVDFRFGSRGRRNIARASSPCRSLQPESHFNDYYSATNFEHASSVSSLYRKRVSSLALRSQTAKTGRLRVETRDGLPVKFIRWFSFFHGTYRIITCVNSLLLYKRERKLRRLSWRNRRMLPKYKWIYTSVQIYAHVTHIHTETHDANVHRENEREGDTYAAEERINKSN